MLFLTELLFDLTTGTFDLHKLLQLCDIGSPPPIFIKLLLELKLVTHFVFRFLSCGSVVLIF